MTAFMPPTLEGMLDPRRGRPPARQRVPQPEKVAPERSAKSTSVTEAARTKRAVGIIPQEDPDGAQSFNLARPVLFDELERRRPRRRAASEWSFILGGTRNYLFINISGPGAFSAGYPRWHGYEFQGCMMFTLGWQEVKKIVRRLYEGRMLGDCFEGYEGSFEEY